MTTATEVSLNSANENDHGHHASACPDCGTPAQGKFCSACGQEIHVHRTLFHLGHELLHGVMHFDGRFWRTLPLLLINPGRLTREWIEGKRTRYVSPLAMFLFTLFVMFMALSFAPQPTNQMLSMPDQISMREDRLAELEKELAEARALADGTAPVVSEADSEDPAAAGIQAGKAAAAIGRIPELELKVEELKARLVQLEEEARLGRKDGLQPGSWQAPSLPT